jgi:glycosyltransferase involved in cell wall biosynthesis
MRVLYYGTYERAYPRNAQVISCLRGAGVHVRERHVPLWQSARHKFSPTARTLVRAVGAEARLALASLPEADVVLVGYPGHLDMLTAKRIGRRLPVVFNPLVSLEDTMVDDRRLVRRGSVLGRTLRLLDRAAFRRADLVVADTRAHAHYFRERFALPPDRVGVCYVGAEDRLFTPGDRGSAAFHVLFVGKLIPLHGLETILAAAKLCPDVEFRVVGSGQLDERLASRPPNVRWEAWVDYDRLPETYRAAGCALGVFGTSEKAARVIPNKAFQALATATPLITAGTDAARELLADGRDALLVPPGNAEALAHAVRRLAVDPGLRNDLGMRGRATYEAHASEATLGRRWRGLLEDLIRRQTKPPSRSAAAGR